MSRSGCRLRSEDNRPRRQYGGAGNTKGINTMSNLDMILDEYAKRGLLDGNAVDRIGAAVHRDAMRHEALVQAARAVVDAVRNDMQDDAHRTMDGRCSAVVEWRSCPARECFTASFNTLLEDLEWELDEEGGAE